MVDEERPPVLHVHGAVVGDVHVPCHLGVVQDAAEVDGGLFKRQVWEVDLTSQSNVILKKPKVKGEDV